MPDCEIDVCRYLRVAVFACCALAGCSRGLEAEVSGTVTLDGKPIGPGAVTFVPVTGATNPAFGAVQADGSYFLKTSRTVGLVAGKYRVSLYIHEVPANMQPGQRLESSRSLIPEKYEKSSTSGLEFDVERGSNTIDIELMSDSAAAPAA